MIHYHPLPPEVLSESDSLWLVEIAEAGYGMDTGAGLLRRGLAGRLDFWRISGDDCEGILLTQVRKNSHGPMLWIEGIAGKGLLRRRRELQEANRALAKRLSCRSVGFQAFRPGVIRAHDLNRVPRVGAIFCEVIS